jgi:hypothetical protein
MEPVNLRETLARLHEQIGSAPRVDAETRRMLGEAMADIERVLHASPSGSSHAPAPEDADHAPRLERLAVHFEADHPSLAAGIRQLADLLGKAGV